MLLNLNLFPLGHGFGINGNILETNIFNLAVVIGVLVYFGGDILSSFLKNRKELILKSLTDAEERYKEATEKLENAKKQLELASVKAKEIGIQGLAIAEQATTNLLERSKEDIKRLEEAKQATIRFEEEKAMAQVCERVTRLAFDLAISKIEKRLDLTFQKRIIDLNIALLDTTSN